MSTLLACLLLGSVILAAPANAEDPVWTDCRSDTNYTRGSSFQANLDALLSSLPGAAAASSGFAKNFTGADANRVYGLAQCRGDIFNVSECRACLEGAVRDLGSRCTAGQKTAMLLYDKCLIRHSNESFFGAMDSSPVWYMWNPQNATQSTAQQFTSALGSLMRSIREKAAHASSPRRFAVGSAAATPFANIYGMAQCTRDLAPGDCNSCLDEAVRNIPTCCDGKQGGRVISRSCFIRFEVYSFYNVQDAEAAMSPASSPGDWPINSGIDRSLPPSTTGGSKRTMRTALLLSIPVAVTLSVVLLFVALNLWKRNRKVHKHAQIASVRHEDDEEDKEMRSSESLLYDLTTLRAATDNFSEENKLGEGGFGPVYKGVLQNGQEIAVKRLSTTSQQGQLEMKNEVVLVAKLQHKNLVRILGCCIQERERILVYEFLSNNSLDKILFDPARQQELSWGQRHRIIQGIGRGLLYLHEDSRLTIIHRDLKASNILLDKDMNPKISDFGLAKLFDVEASVGNTSRIAGTYGYMSPEYALHGIFSTKSDVFSYGVLLLEIITGRRNTHTHVQSSEDLLTFVWRCWRSGSVGELLDGCPADGRQPQEVLRCVHVGLLCVQEDPQLRPGMASIVIMLNSRSITLPAPTVPAFAVLPAGRAIDAHSGNSMDMDPRVAARWPSTNDVSVSDLEPR